MSEESVMLLSFADSSKPYGDQILGAVLVRASDEASAIRRASSIGINPGGDVMSMRADSALLAGLPSDIPVERLLSPDLARFVWRRLNE